MERYSKEAARLVRGSSLVVGEGSGCPQLRRAISNLHGVDFLPRHGLNVYDILCHDQLILSRESILELNGWLES